MLVLEAVDGGYSHQWLYASLRNDLAMYSPQCDFDVVADRIAPLLRGTRECSRCECDNYVVHRCITQLVARVRA